MTAPAPRRAAACGGAFVPVLRRLPLDSLRRQAHAGTQPACARERVSAMSVPDGPRQVASVEQMLAIAAGSEPMRCRRSGANLRPCRSQRRRTRHKPFHQANPG